MLALIDLTGNLQKLSPSLKRMSKNIDQSLMFLGPLMTLLTRGEVAYKNYMANGKIFLYAKILKDNNEKIRALILESSHLLPVEYHACAIDLVAHIDVWHVLWESLNEIKSHGLRDEFVFENDVTFPTDSVSALKALYVKLKT